MIPTRDAWVATFFVVVLTAPVLRLLSVERQTLSHELITITGLLAVALLVCTVLLPARLRSVTRAFGIELVLSSHKLLGLTTIIMILVHVAAVVTSDPTQVWLLVPFLNPQQSPTPLVAHAILEPLLTPPVRSMTGTAAMVALLVLGLLAGRERGNYERWRTWHLVLTLVALGTTAAHIILINHLVPTAAIMSVLGGDPIGVPLLWAKITDLPSLLYLVALALAVVMISLRRWVFAPLSSQGHYRVVEVRRNSRSVSTVAVEPVGAHPAVFEPGQFAWLRLRRGSFAQDHPFTVSSGVAIRPRIEFTVRELGDFSSSVGTLTAGREIWLDGPHGAMTLPDEGKAGLVMICQGVGITPMMAILRTMAATRSGRRKGLSVRLILTDRPGATLFRQELRGLKKDLSLMIFEMAGRQLTTDRLAAILPGRWVRSRLGYYVCGPAFMVEDVIDVLSRLGVTEDRIHTERFDA